ncbi:MAG: c-type cytochrome domain-containing protein [Verrucomicrobiota bacterium]
MPALIKRENARKLDKFGKIRVIYDMWAQFRPRFPRLPTPLAVAGLLAAVAPMAHALDYKRDILPIFMNKCADCHSDKEGESKGGVRFDDIDHFQSRFAKNDMVIPGDFDASYLFVTIFRDPSSKGAMPPKGKGESLNREEVMKVMQWIADGAAINGTVGETGSKPESFEDLIADLPGHHLANEKPADTKPKSNLPERKTYEEQDWTNTDGKTIRAALIKVANDKAHLRLSNGKIYEYPIEKLSEESRKQLKY